MLRILYLEDSEKDVELVRDVLSEYELHWASSKALFVTLLDKHPIDVVLCDSGGPGFDGKEAFALVRSLQPQAVFIFVTGHSDGPVFDALNQSGADAVLSKNHLSLIGETIARVFSARKRDSNL